MKKGRKILLFGLGTWVLLAALFEADRKWLRPDRMRHEALEQWQLFEKAQACIERPARKIYLGNSLLHALRDSLSAEGVETWSVPGEYALHLDNWEQAMCPVLDSVDTVVVQLGINDLLAGFDASEVVSARLRFADMLHKRGVIVIQAPLIPTELPWTPYVRPAQLNRERQEVNRALNPVWIEDRQLFPPDQWKDFTTDGVHPNATGKTWMLELLRDLD